METNKKPVVIPGGLPEASRQPVPSNVSRFEDAFEPRFFRPGGQTQRANRRQGAVFPIPEGQGKLVKE